jgi:hypothetical protein
MLRFFKQPPWDLGTVSLPWGDRPSIYGYIAAHIQAGHSFSGAEERLPDEAEAAEKVGFRWASGALDGGFGHFGGGDEAQNSAEAILAALQALTEKATDERARRLYSQLTKSSAIDHVDALLPMLTQSAKLQAGRVQAVARWLAMGAPDREPVKTALAILGVVSHGEDRDLLTTLGRHDEFTLYSAVAFRHSEADSEPALWALAQHVTGWGRIQIIERLASTTDGRIKAWLLRKGCRNDIMDEYTALICARTGNLIDALRQSDVDDELLKGAGAILAALIRGGPAEGIEAYADGPEATERYLHHLRFREADLEDVNAVVAMEGFLDEDRSKTGDYGADWQRRAAAIRDHINTIKGRPDWSAKIEQGLSSSDRMAFWTAAEAAKAFGIDTWDVHFQRLQQENNEGDWYSVMQTNDSTRIDRVVDLAETLLPLEGIASGPSDELGLGPVFKSHGALDFVLQDLRRFPGKGWRLIRAGLQSPVTRNRNMAVRALAVWDRQAWPPETELLLRQAVKAEPNEDTRRDMQKILAGEPLNELG